MAEEVYAKDVSVIEKRYRPRVRAYAWVGVFVMLFGAFAIAMAYYELRGPSLFPAEAFPWAVGVSLFALMIGVLYVLFTIRGTMRLVREQSIVLARVELHSLEQRYHTSKVSTAPVHAAPIEEVPRGESRSVRSIEGIGPAYENRLAEASIYTLADLRHSSIDTLTEATGAQETTARHWKEMADLLKVPELSPQAAELLVVAGIRTRGSLASSEPDKLYRRLQRHNHAGQLRTYPDVLRQADVRSWVAAAQIQESESHRRTFSEKLGSRRTATGRMPTPG